ncbi:F-box protein At5g07610-like [Bidens hawaiensis]|uniref:F-box protein At5g07610-like n=1 Tax=Bidens hawaiensis TaxID=980011 RepID=UPI00404B0D09
MALAFHQTECVCYKIVCIRALEPDGDLFQIQVYSSDTRTWKICVESFSAQISKYEYPVYCNGAVYWAPDYRSTSSNFLYLKLDDEQLKMLPLPVEMMPYERSIMYFGESRGHLHLIFNTDGEEHILRVNVYEMLKDRSGWLVKYRVQLDGLLHDFPCLVSQYQILDDFGEVEYPHQNDFDVVDVVRGKEEDDTFVVLSSNRKMIRYNVHKKSFKELYRCENYNLHLSGFHRYIETLSSV